MISAGHAGQSRYVSDEVLDARYFRALDRFDIRFAPTMWVFDNVRAGSDVLHLSCGAGMLALLKRKDVVLTGVDNLKESAETARRNGYDATCDAALASLPFAGDSFDYVVSFDLFGALSDVEAGAILAESKRVLRPGGVSMHTISGDAATAGADHVARFRQVFQNVAVDPRYALCLSVEGFLDQESTQLEPDFVEFLRGLSFKERRAFDFATGYMFSRVADLAAPSSSENSRLLLKASDAPLGRFYNEHRDRRVLFAATRVNEVEGGVCLDRSPDALFDEGWFAPELLPPVARSMGRQARIRFPAVRVDGIDLDVRAQLPRLEERPVGVEVALNGSRLCAFTLFKHGWVHLRLLVPGPLQAASGEYELELRADHTSSGDDDDRQVSLAVCNVEVRSQRSEVRGQKSEVRDQRPNVRLISDL